MTVTAIRPARRTASAVPGQAGSRNEAARADAPVLRDLPATEDERRGAGRAARKVVRRGALGDWDESLRSHDALELILAQNRIRVADLVPLRHQRMAASPWNYYRGAAAVMAADLAAVPDSGLTVQLCGDAHLLNFGLWATPERNLAFDLRDFDETLPGPFEWDVKRFAASIEVAARQNRLSPATAAAAVTAGAEAYQRRMRKYAGLAELDIWYDSIHADALVDYFEPADRGTVSVHIERQRQRRTSRRAFRKLTTMTHGRPRITEEPPRRVRVSEAQQARLVSELLAGYRLTLQEDRRALFDRFTEVDSVRQVVGVGSVGMRVYLILLEGRSGADPLFLQAKQAGPAVYEAHAGPAAQPGHGERVISGKRLVQSATDIFVGWGSLGGHDYYLRQFRDMKIIPTTELIAPRLAEFAAACGETLARAHARTGDPVAIAGYLGKGGNFAASMRRFARRYAGQNERDHAQLTRAIGAGTVPAGDG
ncbi:MAG TPA: DUF2252 domain-containing protein [Streptosporangiaceae bacterium]|jgi:uncharacterized protein (DUF2252 family)